MRYIQFSRLATPDSRLPTPDSRLPTPDSLNGVWRDGGEGHCTLPQNSVLLSFVY
ncbi:MAG: hypothetical protein F6J90_02190 [Moorea sp. SIOASIH]|uniref:hypothetical protein n=1 Tax=Moorena sp. SIOASIH TaxID=2607817 RepID=UPI0013BD8535|nr:hypothetical protein [Moorena sp. SIOASIH]NEO35180.1 hypothetical protein [Moorena sp. SIOASIH]